MAVTGWTGAPPDTEAPALPLTSMLLANRERRAGGVLETALARSRGDEARQARDEAAAAHDPDERAGNLVSRGYMPGMISELSMKLADTEAELAAEEDKLGKAARRAERTRQMHERGQIDGFGIAARMLDTDEGDPATVARLQRRAGSLRQQIVEASQLITPPQERQLDGVDAASRHAREVFADVTRQRMAEATARPQAPRPFGSASRSAGLGTEHTGPDCPVCAEGRRMEAARGDAQRSRVRLEDYGYGESTPGGCPPCSGCSYVYCQCGRAGVYKPPGPQGAQVYV